ncbi:glycosyltransferase family 1 protein [Hymenobacter gummosus]|uniref:Glycosyltransferase family 1 protein n=1 Tax=Hymenobacter gummosus TaxID=1776032 RepID=A0A3S0HMJ5_9BACT|nr:glycosyltransferase family 4 protein [Hymenobacter gummosus]RTQ48951.1 glycosyltransferase family 1 protein [Hymenobacter gummosus]
MYLPDTDTLPLRPPRAAQTPASPPLAPARPLRVLWLAPYPYSYTPTTHPVPWVVSLAQRLAARPAEVDLTIVNWEETLRTDEEHYEQDGLHFVFLRTPRTRHDILTLYRWRVAVVARWLRRHYRHYDVIHLHGSELQLPAVVAGLPTDEVPVVLSVQGIVSECVKYVPELSWYKALWTLAGFYERRYLPHIQHFLCRTHWDSAHMQRLSPGARIHHNWEMLRPEFYAATRQPLPQPDVARNPQILFVGGHQVMKGFREALATYARLRPEMPGLQLIVAGHVGAREWAEESRRAGLLDLGPDDVQCVGNLSAAELVGWMRRCFCLLHPSYIDNSPNSVCEAQMAGLAVVASDVGGVSSLVRDDETGLLSSLQPEQLAARVRRLYHDAPLRRRLTIAAQAKALRRHHPDTIVQRTVDLYRLLSQGAG